MKKILLIALIAFVINIKAQLTLEHIYNLKPSSNPYPGYLQLANLTSGGYKYYFKDSSNAIKIYNLNHSLYKTINISVPTGTEIEQIYYLSDQLFNTDTLIEFGFTNYNGSASVFSFGVYNENNNALFYRPINANNFQVFNVGGNFKFSFKSVDPYFPDSIFIYALPGSLPCDACGGVYTGIQPVNNNKHKMPNPYPNPTGGQTTIPYTLPNNEKKGKITFYDMSGKQVKEFLVDDTFNNLIFQSGDLSAGTYYYQLTTNGGISESKKLIVVK